MYKKFTAIFLLLGALIFGNIASAEIKTVESIGEHYMENVNETLDEAKEKAKLFAERDALEEAAVDVQVYSEGHNVNLTHDEIISITAGILYITDVKYQLSQAPDGIMTMKAFLTAEIDTDKISELVEREIKRRESR